MVLPMSSSEDEDEGEDRDDENENEAENGGDGDGEGGVVDEGADLQMGEGEEGGGENSDRKEGSMADDTDEEERVVEGDGSDGEKEVVEDTLYMDVEEHDEENSEETPAVSDFPSSGPPSMQRGSLSATAASSLPARGTRKPGEAEEWKERDADIEQKQGGIEQKDGVLPIERRARRTSQRLKVGEKSRREAGESLSRGKGTRLDIAADNSGSEKGGSSGEEDDNDREGEETIGRRRSAARNDEGKKGGKRRRMRIDSGEGEEEEEEEELEEYGRQRKREKTRAQQEDDDGHSDRSSSFPASVGSIPQLPFPQGSKATIPRETPARDGGAGADRFGGTWNETEKREEEEEEEEAGGGKREGTSRSGGSSLPRPIPLRAHGEAGAPRPISSRRGLKENYGNNETTLARREQPPHTLQQHRHTPGPISIAFTGSRPRTMTPTGTQRTIGSGHELVAPVRVGDGNGPGADALHGEDMLEENANEGISRRPSWLEDPVSYSHPHPSQLPTHGTGVADNNGDAIRSRDAHSISRGTGGMYHSRRASADLGSGDAGGGSGISNRESLGDPQHSRHYHHGEKSYAGGSGGGGGGGFGAGVGQQLPRHSYGRGYGSGEEIPSSVSPHLSTAAGMHSYYQRDREDPTAPILPPHLRGSSATYHRGTSYPPGVGANPSAGDAGVHSYHNPVSRTPLVFENSWRAGIHPQPTSSYHAPGRISGVDSYAPHRQMSPGGDLHTPHRASSPPPGGGGVGFQPYAARRIASTSSTQQQYLEQRPPHRGVASRAQDDDQHYTTARRDGQHPEAEAGEEPTPVARHHNEPHRRPQSATAVMEHPVAPAPRRYSPLYADGHEDLEELRRRESGPVFPQQQQQQQQRPPPSRLSRTGSGSSDDISSLLPRSGPAVAAIRRANRSRASSANRRPPNDDDVIVLD